jgi:HTH-type transcriptional regulator/antitoxin HigA
VTAGNMFQPDWFSSPGETIAEVLREKGLSASELALSLHESEDVVERLLEGREAVTLSLAKRLAAVVGGSMQFWVARDALYRESVARREDAEARSWVAALPVADMSRFRWLRERPAPKDEFQACLAFFGVGDVAEWKTAYQGVLESVAFRQARTLDSKPEAVAAWLRAAQLAAADVMCSEWSAQALSASIPRLRALTKQKDPRRFIPALQKECAAAGVAVSVVRPPSGCRAYGAIYQTTKGNPLVVLSGRQLSDDQLWFTLFHELGHLLLHPHRLLVLEGMNTTADLEEEQADNFAAAAIVPSAYSAQLASVSLNAEAVIRFAMQVGVSPGLIVGQLQHSGRLASNRLNSLKRRYNWSEGELTSLERR